MIETVKGFKDFTGEEAEKREEIRKILVECFENYGFEPAETPIVEYKEFVKGENVTDEAVSDIFKLQDKGKRDLALRYEFTFQLKRLMLGRKLPYKRYSIGPVFRDEPVSGNRMRQFTQCDVDIVGAETKVGIMMNVRKKDIDSVISVLPALQNPTVTELSDKAWCDVLTIVNKKDIRTLIPKLKEKGAEGIVEFPLNKIID